MQKWDVLKQIQQHHTEVCSHCQTLTAKHILIHWPQFNHHRQKSHKTYQNI